MDSVWNNLQRLICHKTQPTNNQYLHRVITFSERDALYQTAQVLSIYQEWLRWERGLPRVVVNVQHCEIVVSEFDFLSCCCIRFWINSQENVVMVFIKWNRQPQFKHLDKAVCIIYRVNTLGKGMNPIILLKLYQLWIKRRAHLFLSSWYSNIKLKPIKLCIKHWPACVFPQQWVK